MLWRENRFFGQKIPWIFWHINTFGYFEIIFPKKIMARGGGLAKVYVVLRGVLANVYKYLQGGRGGSKSPKSRLRRKWMTPMFILLVTKSRQIFFSSLWFLFISWGFQTKILDIYPDQNLFLLYMIRMSDILIIFLNCFKQYYQEFTKDLFISQFNSKGLFS